VTTSRHLRSFGELVVIAATALFFALTIEAYAVKPYVIPSESMLPTLEVGQRVIVDRFSHRIGADPKLNDITVFMPPSAAERRRARRAAVWDPRRGAVCRREPAEPPLLHAGGAGHRPEGVYHRGRLLSPG